MQRMIIALLVGVVIGLLAGGVGEDAAVAADKKPAAPKEIRAQSFTLVDAKGTPRGRLGVDDGGAFLVLWGPGRKPDAVLLSATQIGFGDQRGQPRVLLGREGAGAILKLSDANDRGGASLALVPSGSALTLSDAKGVQRVFLNVTKKGPRLRLLDARGKIIDSLPRGAK